MIKRILSYLLVFILTAAILVGLLTASALIPTDAVRDNFIKSAEFYSWLDNFLIRSSIPDSLLVDRYADITLLEIAYQYDSSAPFRSVISSMHTYGAELQPEILIDIANNNTAPDVSYSRYWHGTTLFLRLFLLFMDIRGVYILNFIVFLALTAILCRILCRKKCIPLMIFLIVGMLLCGVYMMPLCIEYVSTCLMMLMVSIAVLKLDGTSKEKYIPYVFIISGVSVCFFDFLTTETLTLTLPLVLLLSVRKLTGREMKLKETAIFCIKCIALWLVSYGCMFLSKWIISAMVSGAEDFGSILERASFRVSGSSGETPYGNVIAAIVLNLSKLVLFSFTDTYAGIFTAVGIYVFAIAAVVYMFRKQNYDFSIAILIFIIGLIPFGRYIILPSHSQTHAYFTYRAQLSSIVALLSFISLSFDTSIFKKQERKNAHVKKRN